MKSPYSLSVISALILLAGCGGNDPVSQGAENTQTLPAPAQSDATDPSGGAPPPNAVSGGTVEPSTPDRPAARIPAALHGRWGLVPADCTSGRGDTKGLLIIDPEGLRFYESHAVPAANVEVSPDSLSADFAFTGEGMSWTRFQSLQLQDGKLVRTESSPMATYTYARCD